ncbi:unnamed protein product [Brachionus calyciflorus]|uniref:N-acetylgalactosaminide beta-1,3-galactosyltransferase n=1 Tax=Brachionus calyciflorus TaxID=104777 RepID=A0A814ETK5_9BILA|nr:unnamed protein product [Brachionus calyciflorus]
MIPQNKNLFFIIILTGLIILILYQSNSELYSYGQRIKTVFYQPEEKNISLSTDNWIYPDEDLTKNLPSVFCLIKTHPNNIKINKTLNIYKVWARKCDNYRFITLLPEHLRPKNSSETFEVFENFYMIQPKGLVRESHGDLSLKVYYSMIYAYQKFKPYDWYYIADDDAYVNMRNLKEFLKDKSTNESITYGYNFKVIVKDGYHSGGPGYVLSNAAFTTMTQKMIENINNCPNSGIDDVDISSCVRKYNGKKGKSIDEQGRERWLVMSLMTHFTGTYGGWLDGYAENPPRKGLNCCADNLIAVHYMSPRDVFRLDLAIEVQKNVLKLYDNYLKIGKNVTFKNIFKNYVLLEDIENDSNKYKELVNF